MKTQVTEQKLEKYLKLTEEALSKAKLAKNLSKEQEKQVLQFKDMAQRYLSDAQHFRNNGEFVTAFAAVNYAHAWLDAAAISGLLDVKGQNKLFTTD